MGNEFTTEMTVDYIQLTELYRQFSKYGQITRRILMKGDLDNLTTNFTVREAESSRHLMLGNIYKVHNIDAFNMHIDSKNDHVRLISRDTQIMRHKCTNASIECKIGLNDINFRRGPEVSALTGISSRKNLTPLSIVLWIKCLHFPVFPASNSMSGTVLCVWKDFNTIVTLNGEQRCETVYLQCLTKRI
ncbi:hypothetical protein AVEN_270397-1 [Araneus ventricosus]|uniref:Uncharacterized protein n=1 Tax=Araneus ventricosus TaxID=182803 RepID=A0A4Y2LVC6_ARAVE|nr:hypothetical protein AVEN_270397-1 [Araneus ventricosus]